MMEERSEYTDKVCKYEDHSSYPEDEVGFKWLNYSYPFEHSHDHWNVMLVTHGALLNKINGKTFRMSVGEVYIIRPGDRHCTVMVEGQPCQSLNILIRNDYAEKFFNQFREDGSLLREIRSREEPLFFLLSETGLKKTVTGVLTLSSQKIPHADKIFHLKLILHQMLAGMIEQVYPVTQNMPEWLTDFLGVLNDPYLKTTDVKELAAHTPYSYSRLAPLFKSLTGKTIIEYVTRTKMDCAKEFLRGSDMQILEISSILGYESLSHFIRTFKKECGVTPSEYRKEHRKFNR